MNQEYQNLMKDIQANIERKFSNTSSFDEFFLKLLENFSYRYMEDTKCNKAEVRKVSDGIYQAVADTWSFKRPLEIVSKDKKQELVAIMKNAMNGARASARLASLVDTKKLNSDGSGKITVYNNISWDFPDHTDGLKSETQAHEFESDDWEMLRKRFPLFLEEIFDFF